MARQWAAPTLWRCQCIASSFFPRTWIRYMPTFRTPVPGSRVITPGSVIYRSEEHTSELQSRSDLVCRLLLEKKKNQHDHHIAYPANHIHAADHDSARYVAVR